MFNQHYIDALSTSLWCITIRVIYYALLMHIISKQIKVILVSSYKSKIDQVQMMCCANVCGTK